MASSTDWKFEAWKAAVSLTEKLFLVLLGTLVIPVVLQKGSFPSLLFVIGCGMVFVCLIFWLILVTRGYRKRGEVKDER